MAEGWRRPASQTPGLRSPRSTRAVPPRLRVGSATWTASALRRKVLQGRPPRVMVVRGPGKQSWPRQAPRTYERSSGETRQYVRDAVDDVALPRVVLDLPESAPGDVQQPVGIDVEAEGQGNIGGQGGVDPPSGRRCGRAVVVQGEYSQHPTSPGRFGIHLLALCFGWLDPSMFQKTGDRLSRRIEFHGKQSPAPVLVFGESGRLPGSIGFLADLQFPPSAVCFKALPARMPPGWRAARDRRREGSAPSRISGPLLCPLTAGASRTGS